jgi:hypothetical protein
MFSRPIIVMLLTLLSWFSFAATHSAAQPEMKTGLEGEIRIAPIRGGPARLGVDDSKPLANTVFVVKQEEKTVASFETDAQGRFRLSLAPGKYRISKKDWKGRFGSYGPFEVDIVAGQTKKVQWECDSGMQ